jgi:microcin C transport system substrate-binding protein
VYANRFGMPKTRPVYDVGLETWWQISPTPLTNAQAESLQHTAKTAGVQ